MPCGSEVRRVMVVYCSDKIEPGVPDAALFAKRGLRGQKRLADSEVGSAQSGIVVVIIQRMQAFVCSQDTHQALQHGWTTKL